jgi:REP element-mobilizing transposase RayT
MTFLIFFVLFLCTECGFDEQVDEVLREVCLEIEKRYEIKFIEIGVDKDHVHFLVQSVPTYSVTKLVKMSKSLTAKEVFRRCPQVKQKLALLT